MTEIELLTQRWFLLQEARLKEMQEIAAKTDRSQHFSLIQTLNGDPFWENAFDILEKAIREIDPNHEFLTENPVPV